jgi:hypothetical protein
VPVVGPEPCAGRDRRPTGVAAGVGGGARGWNADQFGRRLCLVSSTSSVSLWCGGLERDRVWWVVVGTLLGPEGTGRALVGVGVRLWWEIVLVSYRPVGL